MSMASSTSPRVPPKSMHLLYEELSHINFNNPNGIQVMREKMYDLFKKRRLELLSNDQVATLIEELKKYHERNKTN